MPVPLKCKVSRCETIETLHLQIRFMFMAMARQVKDKKGFMAETQDVSECERVFTIIIFITFDTLVALCRMKRGFMVLVY